MTEPRSERTWDLPVIGSGITTEQAHQAGLAVAFWHRDQPAEARELLDMLGVLDLLRGSRGSTAASRAAADPDTAAGPALVDSATAAQALHMWEATLTQFEHAEILCAADIDADGCRWWNLPDLRRQIAAYRSSDDQASPDSGGAGPG